MKSRQYSMNFLFFITALGSATRLAAGSGATAVPFLSMGVGARPLAMGEAATGGVSGAETMDWNPAGLMGLGKRSATFMHAAMIEETSLDYAAYSQPLNGFAWGMSVRRFSAGAVDGTDEFGNPSGNIEPSDLAFSAVFAGRVKKVDLGLAAKFIQSELVDTAQTGAVDLGVRTPALFNGKARFGLALANLGGDIQYDQEKSPLPFVARGGVEYRPGPRWNLTADVAAPRGEDLHLAFGGEYTIAMPRDASLTLRGGYNTRELDGGGAQGLSAGLGFGWAGLRFDYAFVSRGDLDPTQVVSIGYSF